MGFQPRTLRHLAGRSNQWAIGDSMVGKGGMWVFSWLELTVSYGHTAKWWVDTYMYVLITASRSHIEVYQKLQPTTFQSEY